MQNNENINVPSNSTSICDDCFGSQIFELLTDVSFWHEVSWPIAMIIAIWMFRKPINSLCAGFSSFANKLASKEVSYHPQSGFRVSNHSQSINSENLTANNNIENVLQDRQYLLEKIRKLEPFTEKEAENLNMSLEDYYKARFVEFVLAREFEIIYRNIFGSQIAALQFLADNNSDVSTQIIQNFYDIAKNAFQQDFENFRFEQWLSFLIRSHLINIQNDTITITEDGKEFLQYITLHGYATNKIF